ncbi:MAG: CDP-diacylglycerol--serine O-phosphatidyltransferase [Acidobacteriota bacterium]
MKSKPASRRRGIYFLPSVFTVGNVFCGFYSIVCSMRGELELGSVLIGFAVLLDALDGRVARLANATSDFGREFDSLADLVSFGVAPAVLVYIWALSLWPRIGWLTCFLFLICGAMRLARFNIQGTVGDKRFFVGMPIPAAAGVPASMAFMFPKPLESRAEAVPVIVLVLLLAFLMVSTLRYYSFKDIDLRRRRQPYLVILFLALLFFAIGTHPQVMLLSMATGYMISGPALKLYSVVRRTQFTGAASAKEALTSSFREDDEG